MDVDQVNIQTSSFQFTTFKDILDQIDRQNNLFIQRKSVNALPMHTANNQDQLNKDLSRNTAAQLSSQFDTYFETISTFDKNYNITQQQPSKQIPATYLKLTEHDLPLIIEAINNNSDGLRLFFGCKALRKLLSTGHEDIVQNIVKLYPTLAKRLIQLMLMPQKAELYMDVSWCLVNITSIRMDYKRLYQLIEFGLFDALLCMIDETLQELERTELAVTAICNSISDQEKAKKEVLMVEQIKGQIKVTLIDKIEHIITNMQKA